MKEITSHQINVVNKALKIEAHGEPAPGGAHTRYNILGFDTSDNPGRFTDKGYAANFLMSPIVFQNGDPSKVGVNGITHEALLAILIDRLESFQSGPYACEENAQALSSLVEVRYWLSRRTENRRGRGEKVRWRNKVNSRKEYFVALLDAYKSALWFIIQDETEQARQERIDMARSKLVSYFESQLPAEENLGAKKHLEDTAKQDTQEYLLRDILAHYSLELPARFTARAEALLPQPLEVLGVYWYPKESVLHIQLSRVPTDLEVKEMKTFITTGY